MIKKVQSAVTQGVEQEEKFYSSILDGWVTKTEFLKKMEGGIHFEAIQNTDFNPEPKKDDGFVRTGFFDGYWLLEPKVFKRLIKILKAQNIRNTNLRIA